MGLSGFALSLSWTDLSVLFAALDPGVLFGDDAAQCGRAVVDTAKIKRDAALPIPVCRAVKPPLEGRWLSKGQPEGRKTPIAYALRVFFTPQSAC